MKIVKIYIETSTKGPRKTDGVGGFILETETKLTPATFTKFIELEDCAENRAQMLTILEALKKLKAKCELWLFTDCDYIASVFRQNWIQQWKEKGWKNSKGKDVGEWQQVGGLLDGQTIKVFLKEHHEYAYYLQSEVKRRSKNV